MNTAICYMTGNSNEQEMRRRFTLLPKEYSNFILKDKNCVFNSNENVFEFDFDHFQTGENIWTNTYFSILEFYEKHPDFDYYWLIEDDVIFNGDWTTFFDPLKEEDADYIVAYYHIQCLKNYKRGWYHIKRNLFKGDFKPKSKAGAFVGIQRFSNKLLKKMLELTKNKVHVHCEVFAISIADHFGFKIKNLRNHCFNIKFFDHNHRFDINHLPQGSENHLIHAVKF